MPVPTCEERIEALMEQLRPKMSREKGKATQTIIRFENLCEFMRSAKSSAQHNIIPLLYLHQSNNILFAKVYHFCRSLLVCTMGG